MDLSVYKDLSGLEVSDSQRGFVTANIARAQLMIETALGFPLGEDAASENLYNERGKTQSDYWPCDVTDEDLLAPDNEPDAVYRLFGFRTLDALVHVDPCTSITKLKIVHGDVTVYTFESNEFALRLGRGGIGRLIELRSVFPNRWHPWCRCGLMAQLAVDAAWLGIPDEDDESDPIPDDLKAVWADLVTWLSDKTRLIKSESRGTRSYTKAEVKSPLVDEIGAAVLARYAGPRGTAGRLRV